jgi:hypothetical protein
MALPIKILVTTFSGILIIRRLVNAILGVDSSDIDSTSYGSDYDISENGDIPAPLSRFDIRGFGRYLGFAVFNKLFIIPIYKGVSKVISALVGMSLKPEKEAIIETVLSSDGVYVSSFSSLFQTLTEKFVVKLFLVVCVSFTLYSVVKGFIRVTKDLNNYLELSKKMDLIITDETEGESKIQKRKVRYIPVDIED